jgi:hypothetical protein
VAAYVSDFPSLQPDRELNQREATRVVRQLVSAQYEAVEICERLAAAVDNRRWASDLRRLAEEELLHASDLMRLLKDLRTAAASVEPPDGPAAA